MVNLENTLDSIVKKYQKHQVKNEVALFNKVFKHFNQTSSKNVNVADISKKIEENVARRPTDFEESEDIKNKLEDIIHTSINMNKENSITSMTSPIKEILNTGINLAKYNIKNNPLKTKSDSNTNGNSNTIINTHNKKYNIIQSNHFKPSNGPLNLNKLLK